MGMKAFLWYGVLGGITVAYILLLWGARAARQQHVTTHSRLMVITCTIVGIWLVAYITKQILFGRDQFPGTAEQYWRMYIPVLTVHTTLAVITVGLGVYNLYTGLTRLRRGPGVGAMVAGVTRHRRLGKILLGTFSGTLVTAYMVYALLFHWPAIGG
jgi:putative membrane protein